MEKQQKQAEDVQGTRSRKTIGLTFDQIEELAKDQELLQSLKTLAEDENNKGQAGNVMMMMARALKKQLSLL